MKAIIRLLTPEACFTTPTVIQMGVVGLAKGDCGCPRDPRPRRSYAARFVGEAISAKVDLLVIDEHPRHLRLTNSPHKFVRHGYGEYVDGHGSHSDHRFFLVAHQAWHHGHVPQGQHQIPLAPHHRVRIPLQQPEQPGRFWGGRSTLLRRNDTRGMRDILSE